MNRSSRVRSGFIFLFFCLAACTLLANLYRIQILQQDFYTSLAKHQYCISLTQTPPRAPIYDRHHNLLALNKETTAAFILPRKLEDRANVELFLQAHFPKAYDRLKANPDQHFLFIKRKLSPTQIELIETQAPCDVHLLAQPSRFYPVESLGPVIGLTDIDNKGIMGLEQIYHDTLAGSPTTLTLYKDARSGRYHFKKETTHQGNEGSPLITTLDGTLCHLAYQALGKTLESIQAQEGEVIIMDPTTGEIHALVQYPCFDPNQTASMNVIETRLRPITDLHEFGSVLKIFVALAMLQEGVVTPDELIDCENSKRSTLNGIPFTTTAAHGIIPFSSVITLSNNIGIAKVAQRMGKKLYTHLKTIGFGAKSGINFPGEPTGIITHPSNWSKQSLISLSFGYEISCTLLQLATAFCMLVNDGNPVVPCLVAPTHVIQKPKTPYTTQTLNIIHDFLEKTVQEGTAKRAQRKGYKVMGKTGTANMLVNGVYDKQKNIYTFAGCLQKGDYKRVVVVSVQNSAKKNLLASAAAVPLFNAIIEHLIIHDKLLTPEVPNVIPVSTGTQ